MDCKGCCWYINIAWQIHAKIQAIKIHLHQHGTCVGREAAAMWRIVRQVGLREMAYFLWLYWGRHILSELGHEHLHFICHYCAQFSHCSIRGWWHRAAIDISACWRTWSPLPERDPLVASLWGFLTCRPPNQVSENWAHYSYESLLCHSKFIEMI